MNILYLLVTLLFLGNSCLCGGSSVSSVSSSAKRVNEMKNQTNTQQQITRIIGAQLATVPIPYQISLQKFYPSIRQWRHTCGGSIITKSHILTAAHCTDNHRAEEFSVVVGTSHLKYGGLRHLVKSYVQHELYTAKGSSVFNDLAVIKVAVPFQFNERVAPIRLADSFSRRMESNFPVTLTGWGVTDMYSQIQIPDNLMILNYNTIENEACKLRGFKQLSTNELCAFYGKSRGSCLGDSGGPLVNRERNIQIGIVSYGSRFCANNRPDVYVRVSNYVPWIKNAVTDLIP